MSSLDGLAAASLDHHVLQGEAGQVLSHVIANIGPYAQKHALSLVVTGAVTVRLAKITSDDRTVDRGHDLGERDRFGVSSEDIAASDTALGPDQSHALETEQDLLEVRLGESGALGEVPYRGWRGLVFSEGQTEQRPACVVATC